MLELIADFPKNRVFQVLCIGAHCDDIEIGCGGTLLQLQNRRQPVTIDFAILTGVSARQKEARSAMTRFVQPQSRGALIFGDLKDGYIPSQYEKAKHFVEELKTLARPDLIFCHEREDRHQDHRIVNEMTWNTFRDHLILEYEIPKWDGGLGQPNVYIPLPTRVLERKIASLIKSYPSQSSKDWFTADTLRALPRLRGIECRAPQGHAEAFHGRKLRLASLF